MKLDNTYATNPIKIGKNQLDNDEVIQSSQPNDIWFHLADYPSGHVVLTNTISNKPTNEMIAYCCLLTKHGTKHKNKNNILVHYTEIKNIQRTEIPGRVILLAKPNEMRC